ncbi:RDD family protein [Rudaea sp.]|uniref:RDD family protein n=1 Tax=Rudaea sp. TaxID=2136325 RepID=UPI002ED2F270
MDNTNPYQAPNARLSEFSEESEVASKGQRFGTWIIDYIVFIIISGIIGALIALTFGHAGVQYLRGPARFVISILVFLIYYIGFESAFGRTLGKFALGTKVITEGGGAPSLGQVIGRSFARMIPSEAFSLLFSDTNSGWHDTLPKTKVVRTRKRS